MKRRMLRLADNACSSRLVVLVARGEWALVEFGIRAVSLGVLYRYGVKSVATDYALREMRKARWRRTPDMMDR